MLRTALTLGLCIVLSSCGSLEGLGKSSYSFLPDREDLSALKQDESYTRTRLISRHLFKGQVVSVRDDGTLEHTGDALLWSGLALGSLPCTEAEEVESALARMVESYGSFVRFNPLAKEYLDGREVSNDGYIGVLFGYARYLQRCPSNKASIQEVWAAHRRALASWGGELYEGTGVKFPDIFSLVPDALSHKLDLRKSADTAFSPGRMKLEIGATGWAKAVMTKKAACYRIHLATLLLIASDALGETPSKTGKAAFCGATGGADLPLTDWLCGRRSAKSYLENHPKNAYEYRSQRCGYEKPDGDAGLDTPWLDYLVIYSLAAEGET